MDSKQKTGITTGISDLLKSGGHTLNVAKNVEDGQIVHLPLEALNPSRYQTRRITPDRVKQLAETIKQQGLLQPVTVRPLAEGYELIAGHRRREAFCLLLAAAETDADRKRWSTIPSVVRLNLTEVQAASLTAIENLERDDGDPLEQGHSLLKVKQTGEFTTNAQIATATGLSVNKVTRLVRLAEAPAVFQQAVSPGVFVEIADPSGGTRKEHRKLEPSLALAGLPLYRHYEKALGEKGAVEKTGRFLERAARASWSRLRLEAEVRKVVTTISSASDSHTDGEALDEAEKAGAETPKPARRALYRDRGADFVLYPKNFADATAEEAQALLDRLAAITTTLRDKTSPGDNHR